MVSRIFQKYFSLILTLAIALPLLSYSTNAAAKRKASKYTWKISGKVNINTGGVKNLSCLPGIGKKKAISIISYRKNSKFKKVDQLRKIKGIGRKLLNKIRKYIVLSGDNTIKRKRVRRKKK
jgi:competence ComEA-like helix-hairpin-helix protein